MAETPAVRGAWIEHSATDADARFLTSRRTIPRIQPTVGRTLGGSLARFASMTCSLSIK